MQSSKWTLNKYDISKWSKNLLIFCSPAIVALLVSLQGGVNWKVAVGMATQALVSAGIDLFRKLAAE